MIEYENNIPHMYLDTYGKVTVGVGHLIKTAQDAQKLPFVDEKKIKATPEAIKAGFENVKKQLKNMKASYYKKYTKLTLNPTDIDQMLEKHIASFHKEIKIVFPEFDTFPSEVRLALLDIIFNVGMTDLRTGWTKMKAAIKAKNWMEAGKESRRKPPIPTDRNDYVRKLFEKAAKKP